VLMEAKVSHVAHAMVTVMTDRRRLADGDGAAGVKREGCQRVAAAQAEVISAAKAERACSRL
jgi:hypothetical protein